SDWTVEAGTMVGAHLERTEGQQSLEVATDGYTVIRSRLLGPLGHVAERISLDLKMPIGQPNPYWYGAAQLFVSVPSLGLHNAYIGQQDLTGLSLGQFVEIGFAVPVDILEALRGDYADLQFALALNVPQGVQGSYLIDNFQVSESIPERSTISAPDLRRILGMETDADWSSPTSALQSNFSPGAQGKLALALAPAG